VFIRGSNLQTFPKGLMRARPAVRASSYLHDLHVFMVQMKCHPHAREFNRQSYRYFLTHPSRVGIAVAKKPAARKQ
jgi:hypothetical protein